MWGLLYSALKVFRIGNVKELIIRNSILKLIPEYKNIIAYWTTILIILGSIIQGVGLPPVSVYYFFLLCMYYGILNKRFKNWIRNNQACYIKYETKD